MATQTSWGTVFNRIIGNEAPGLGMLFTGTASISTATVTTSDVRVAAMGAEAVSTRYEGRILWIPSASAADAKRSILGISVNETTGVTTITVVGNYGATYGSPSGVDMYILADDPDTLLDIGVQALKMLSFEAETPLRHGPDDADMQASGTSDWTGTATLAKTTTAGNVWAMAQALSVTDGGAGGQYAESSLVNVTGGTQVTVHFIARGGSGQVQVLDASNNVLETLEFDSLHWVYGQHELNTSVQQVKLRLVTVDASGVIYYQGAWVVREWDTIFRLPASMDPRIVIENLSRAHFWEAAQDSGGSSGELYAGDSAIYRSLTEGVDWQAFRRTADAHTRMVRLTSHTGDWPLFLLWKCSYYAPYGTSVTLTSLSSTSVIPEDLWTAQVKHLIGKYYPEDWPQLEGEGHAEVVSLLMTHEEKSPAPQRVNGFAAAFRSRR